MITPGNMTSRKTADGEVLRIYITLDCCFRYVPVRNRKRKKKRSETGCQMISLVGLFSQFIKKITSRVVLFLLSSQCRIYRNAVILLYFKATILFTYVSADSLTKESRVLNNGRCFRLRSAWHGSEHFARSSTAARALEYEVNYVTAQYFT